MSKPHILIVDDVVQNMEIAAHVLRHEDCQISFAQSGDKALEIIENEEVNLVLLDIMMPDMDGFEICERIKADKKNEGITIMFITAMNDIESITHAFQAGGIDYITKPFNSDELRARVHNQIALSQAIEENKRQKQVLEETNAFKDKLFSIIAHDLRNPFNGLLLLSEILKFKLDEMNTEEIKTMINLIYYSTKDGYELLENLLEWNRSQNGKIKFQPVQTDITKLIHGNVQFLSPLAFTKDIEIKAGNTESLVFRVDQRMTDSIIRNLITNAIKFTPNNGSVSISATRIANTLEIKVSDTGMGIPKSTQDSLFNLSEKKSRPGTANERGTGLGLLLCKEFVDRHQGRIEVESSEDEGSTFTVSLPEIDC
jgi:two-component system sensor histidine kinase/response regulator